MSAWSFLIPGEIMTKCGVSMRLQLTIVCVAVFCVLTPHAVRAQQNTPVAVEIVASTDPGDNVGERWVFQLKEAVRRSAAFRLTEGSEARLRILVSTMNRLPDNPNLSTMYSVIWVLKGQGDLPILLDSTMGYAGSNTLQSSVEGVLARTDRVLSDLTRLMNSK